MQIILHCGVYSSDTKILLNALKANCTDKLPYKTQITDPETTRVVIRKLLRAGRDNELPEDARDIIFEMAGVEEDTERLVLANPAVLGTYRDFVEPNIFFPNAVEYIGVIRKIFQEDQLAISYAMCNPATLFSSVMKAAKVDTLEQIIGMADPLQLRWAELAQRLQAAFPNTYFTMWFNEDILLIWKRLLQTLLDIQNDVPVESAHAPLAAVIAPANMKKFEAYVDKHPGMIDAQARRVITTFVNKFAIPERMDVEIDVPDWSQEYVDLLTVNYEQEQDVIAGLDKVHLITP